MEGFELFGGDEDECKAGQSDLKMKKIGQSLTLIFFKIYRLNWKYNRSRE